MVKVKPFVLLLGLLMLVGCRKAHDVSVFWYMSTEVDTNATFVDSIGIIKQAYDKQLLPLGNEIAWKNDNFSYCRRIIIPHSMEDIELPVVTSAAEAAYYSLGENFKVNGWNKCVMTVTMQEVEYSPKIIISHDYSTKNAQ